MKLRTTHTVLEEASSAVKRYSINEKLSVSLYIDHETDMNIIGLYILPQGHQLLQSETTSSRG